ncbi:MAG: DUF1559 domain-containing protein [Gemmataceae bacterium]|nr:DUF1559 domain-containing protein [Gemmataceae bacterium]
MRSLRRACRPGLTKTDVVVVVVVLLTVVGLFLAMLPRAHEDSHRIQCAFQLKHIGEAILRFHERHKALPAARIADGYATWAVQIAPDLSVKQAGALAAWELQLPYYHQPQEVRAAQVPFYYCPARRTPTYLSSGEMPWEGKPPGGPFPGALGDYACVAGNGQPREPVLGAGAVGVTGSSLGQGPLLAASALLAGRALAWDGPEANGPLILGRVLRKEGERVLAWESRTRLADLEGRRAVVILVGEKHVPRAQFGEVKVGDGSLYNGDYPASSARVGGLGFGIARSPDDPFNRNFGSYHLGGVCQFVQADTSVKAFTPDIEEATLGRLTVRRLP